MENYNHLVAACRKQDSSAQMRFYTLFCQGVYNSSLRIVGNGAEAEEVMQETFLKVFTRPHLFQKDAKSMERMLRRIAVNHSIDLYRKRSFRFEEFSERHSATLPDEAPGEAEEAFEASVETIRTCIRELPEGYRVILSLHLLEGMKYEEIARQLKISASGVRSQYVRARRKLQELVQEKRTA